MLCKLIDYHSSLCVGQDSKIVVVYALVYAYILLLQDNRMLQCGFFRHHVEKLKLFRHSLNHSKGVRHPYLICAKPLSTTTSSGCSWVADSARETLGFAGLSCFATHSRFLQGRDGNTHPSSLGRRSALARYITREVGCGSS